jgi:DNA-binding CsgD family transcriptional regulator
MTTQPSRRGRGRPPHPDILTPREWQALDLLRQGLTNEQIAQRLDISFATAKYHVAEIISKLGVQTREEAAAWQPEAVAVHWWQRASAPLTAALRRIAPLTLTKAAIAAGALGALLGLALLSWALFRPDADETKQDAAAANPVNSTTPAFTIDRPQDTRLIFIRGQTNLYEPGTLWISNLDGSGQRQLVTATDVSEFIGAAPDPVTGETLVYYITKPAEGPDRREVWRANAAGQEEPLLRLEAKYPSSHMAELSPDGRFIAYTDTSTLGLLDIASRESQPVSVNAPGPTPSCFEPGCIRFFGPHWSPDGSRLLVTFGGLVLLIDPFGADEPISFEGCCYGWWSPSGNSLCGTYMGRGLFVLRAPDWQPHPFLEDYEPQIYRTPSLVTTSYLDQRIGSCSWIDDQRLAVVLDIFIDPDGRQVEVFIIDTASGATGQLARRAGTPSTITHTLGIQGRNMLILQARSLPPYIANAEHPDTPVLLDLSAGLSQPLLTEADWVVAVLDQPAGLD